MCSFAAHSSLDEYVAHWFGLNQSKYQWALDDYYESKGVVSFPSTQFLVFSVVFDVMILFRFELVICHLSFKILEQ